MWYPQSSSPAVIDEQALLEYVSVLRNFHQKNYRAAYDRIVWAIDYFNLSNHPDAIILKVAIAQQLPESDTDHLDGVPYGDMKVINDNRAQYLSLHQAVVNEGVDVGPHIVPSYSWALFDATFPIEGTAAIRSAWAMTLIDSEEYKKAYDVLNAFEEELPLYYAAWLSLFLRTERWNDLRTMGAKVRSFASAYAYELIGDVATACLGMAEASLGQTSVAIELVKTAEHSVYSSVSAWAYYIHGLIIRTTTSDEDKARELFSKSLSLVHTTWANSAFNSTDRLLRITSLNNINMRTDQWDILTEPDPEIERQKFVKDKQKSYLEQANMLMQRQVGMENIKQELNRITISILVGQERKARGGDPKPANYNMVLTGPPGTGKSTVVQAFAYRLAAIGVIDDPEPLVTGKSDFVDNKVGGSAILTRQTIEKAKGKVLFIDEFYSLVQGDKSSLTLSNTDSFGKEALDELVGQIDRRIGEMVVVVAGYPDDIDRIMQINEGLPGRFPRRIAFQSSTLDQLAAIAQKEAEDRGMTLSHAAREYLTDPHGDMRKLYITDMGGRKIIDILGNGRFARNMIERATEDSDTLLVERLGGDISDLSISDITSGLKSIDASELNAIPVEAIKHSFNSLLNAALNPKEGMNNG